MSQPAKRGHGFATTARGLEPFLESELRGLGFKGVRPGFNGVAFRGGRGAAARACACLRTAHRVLLTLADVDAATPDALYRSVRQVADWPHLIPPDKTFAVFATARDSAFNDARFAALRVKDAVVDAVRDALDRRPRVDVADPDVVLRLGVRKRSGVLSLDAGGRTSLHARGYRRDAGHAPLRETLAAAAVMASGWDGVAPLLDPFCGSGTLLIEAALIARRVAPALVRRAPFGHERWPRHHAERHAAALERLRAAVRDARPPIFGADLDPRAIEIARANAARAGVGELLRLRDADARRIPVPDGHRRGWIIANPPWGRRLGDQRAALGLARAFGRRLRQAFGGWRGCLVLHDEAQIDALELPTGQRWPVRSGPVDVWFVRFDVPARRR